MLRTSAVRHRRRRPARRRARRIPVAGLGCAVLAPAGRRRRRRSVPRAGVHVVSGQPGHRVRGRPPALRCVRWRRARWRSAARWPGERYVVVATDDGLAGHLRRIWRRPPLAAATWSLPESLVGARRRTSSSSACASTATTSIRRRTSASAGRPPTSRAHRRPAGRPAAGAPVRRGVVTPASRAGALVGSRRRSR